MINSTSDSSREFKSVYDFSLILPARLKVLQEEVAQSTIETAQKIAAGLVGKKVSVLVKSRVIVTNAYENFKAKAIEQYAQYSDKRYQDVLNLCIGNQKKFFMGELRKQVKQILQKANS